MKENSDNQEIHKKDIIKYVSNLSWRQMNCFDRCLAVLLGNVNHELVNYFKLLLGSRYGFDIAGFMVTHFQQEWSLEKEIYLDIFGIDRKFIKFDIATIHDIISESIDIYGSAIVRLDEYYLFFSPYYLNTHTNHLTVINGYDKDKQRYSITGSDHIIENYDSEKINFGNFYTLFNIIKDTYTNRPEADWFFSTFDKVDEQKLITPAKLKQILVELLDFLAKNDQAGNDIIIIRDILDKKRELADTENLSSLYRILGGKELLIGTLLDYFVVGSADTTYLRELSNKVISLTNNLINSYLVANYRKKELKVESTLSLIHEIQVYSAKFFQEMRGVFECC